VKNPKTVIEVLPLPIGVSQMLKDLEYFNKKLADALGLPKKKL